MARGDMAGAGMVVAEYLRRLKSMRRVRWLIGPVIDTPGRCRLGAIFDELALTI